MRQAVYGHCDANDMATDDVDVVEIVKRHEDREARALQPRAQIVRLGEEEKNYVGEAGGMPPWIRASKRVSRGGWVFC